MTLWLILIRISHDSLLYRQSKYISSSVKSTHKIPSTAVERIFLTHSVSPLNYECTAILVRCVSLLSVWMQYTHENMKNICWYPLKVKSLCQTKANMQTKKKASPPVTALESHYGFSALCLFWFIWYETDDSCKSNQEENNVCCLCVFKNLFMPAATQFFLCMSVYVSVMCECSTISWGMVKKCSIWLYM